MGTCKLQRRLCSVIACFAMVVCAGETSGQATQPATQPLTLTIRTAVIHSGEAVPGAAIEFYVRGQDQKATTSASGEATVNVAGDATQFSMIIKKEGWVPMVWRWSATPKDQAPPKRIEITMEKAAEVGGYLVDENNEPLAGGTVLLVLTKTYGDRRQGIYNSYDAVSTDKDGKWTYKEGPAVVDGVEIGPSHPLCLGQFGFYELREFDDLAGLKLEQARVVLARSPGILMLTVTDAGGKPLAGASVGYGADRVASNALADMTTNEDGKLTLGVPAGGQAVLTVKAKGFAPDMWVGQAGAQATAIAMALKPGKPLTGRVVDLAGKPVAGAYVFFDTWRGMRTLVDEVRTGADGTFSWASAPADTVVAAVQANGLLRQDGVKLTVGQENLVTLKKSTLLKGRVVDGATGEAIKSYRVVWGIAFPNQRVIWERNQPAPKIKEDGSFETTFSGFYPGYVFRIEAAGYEAAVGERVDAFAGNTVEQVYRMKKGTPVEGVLLLPSGDPEIGAKVYLATASDEVDMEGSQIMDRHDMLPVTNTDGRGHFTFDPQGDAFALFVTNDDGYAAVSKGDLAKSGGKVTLTPWSRIEGAVKQNGAAVANAKLMVQYQGAPGFSAEGGPAINMHIEASADATGKYVIEHAFAGTVQTAVRLEQAQGQMVMVRAGDKSAPAAVKAGQTAEVDVGQ